MVRLSYGKSPILHCNLNVFCRRRRSIVLISSDIVLNTCVCLDGHNNGVRFHSNESHSRSISHRCLLITSVELLQFTLFVITFT